MNKVVLSLFGGVGLLDMGFREAGFCVVRAGDLLWGSDIKKFNATPLKGKIAGVIGGVPCQAFSSAVKKENRCNYENLWSEYYRIVKEVEPVWFLAENVKGAKDEALSMFNTPNNYYIKAEIHDFSKLGSAQKRIRLITFGTLDKKLLNSFWNKLKNNGLKYGQEWRGEIGRENGCKYSTVTGTCLENQNTSTGKPARYIRDDKLLDAFDLPVDFKIGSKTIHKIPYFAQARMIIQGVPVAAAYALAMSVKEAMANKLKTS